MIDFGAIKRWLYRGGRPHLMAAVSNRLWALAASAGLFRDWVVTLEVRGRKSGKLLSFPLVIAHHEGQRYLVSMLGEEANWVANVRAAGGRATMIEGRREPVRLDEVPIGERAPIIKQYLREAPGARPHIPIDKQAPLNEFERIAASFPVFRITTEAG